MGSKFLTALKKESTAAGDVLTTKGDLVTFSTSVIRLGVGSNGQVLTAASGQASGLQWATPIGTESFVIAASDETTALTTGTKATFRMPYAFTLSAVRASVTTAPAGSVLTVDINEGGSTILSTKLTIDSNETTSTTAATAPVISDTSLADDSQITIDIDGVGSSTAGAGLKVTLIGKQS
tara:strand:+ start:515 stop:1054 length:540 start_codon:yes stop_codon:yes gene_type:complete